MSSDLLSRYPMISDLEELAKRHMPYFSWEFFDSGTGRDEAARRNCSAFSDVILTPRFMQGEFQPRIDTTLFGNQYAAPFGISPVGMNSLSWPGTDRILAAAAGRHGIPYSMSTAANETPETLGPLTNGMGWFQLYPPRNSNIRNDILARVKEAGFTTLLVTIDVPAMSRRERQLRAGVSAGSGVSAKLIWQAAMRPRWALATLRNGWPGLPTLERYSPSKDLQHFLAFVGNELNGTFDWHYLDTLRREWDGPLVLKGILDPREAEQAVQHGVDGIMVSNHGGRQLDSAPAPIAVLPSIAQAVNGKATLLLDSGVRSGLDIAKALALGADFVLLGRAFMYAVAALGTRGADHAVHILTEDLKSNMSNLGCATLAQLSERALVPAPK